MTAFCSYTGGELHMPLIYRFVYDVLSSAVPHTQQALTLLVDIIYAFLVDPLLHYSPDLIIHWVHIWAVWGHGREKWSLASLGVKVRLCQVPCAQVRCPVGIWNCHPIFPWCMATASPSAALHANSRRSLSLQVAQKQLFRTPEFWHHNRYHYACAERRAFS